MTNPEHTVRTNASGKRLAAQRRHHERAMDETVRDAPAVKRATHTPGPWEAYDADYGYSVADSRLGDGVAWVTTKPAETRWSDAVCRANARLMAASPEMLAQLKHCYAMATKLGDEKWAAEIRAVIVKAIGDVSW